MTSDGALKLLLARGWKRAEEDFDPVGYPRPFLMRRRWKAVVSRNWVTFWALLRPGCIESIFSAPTHDEVKLRAAEARAVDA